MAIVDSIGCAGQAHRESSIIVSGLALSRFYLFSSSRPKRIPGASVSSLMICV